MQIDGGMKPPMISASTPPRSDSSHVLVEAPTSMVESKLQPIVGQFDDGFDALIDYGVVELDGMEDWSTTLEEGMHGESGGFMMDMDWMKYGEAAGFDIWGQHSPDQQHHLLSKEEDPIYMMRTTA